MASAAHDARPAVMTRWQDEAARLDWARPWTQVYEPGARGGRFFVDGEVNVAVNCLDRHVLSGGDRVALYWEGEPGDRRQMSYRELQAEVCALAAALSELGVETGDRVALHLGWLPETVVAMLACARIGAVFALLPAPLPPDALADRLGDLRPTVLFTQDAAWRHGVMLPLKARADEALAAAETIQHSVVVHRTGVDITWYEGDHWYHDLLARGRTLPNRPPAAHSTDQPLLVVYLANRRGRPAGIVHGSGGLLTYAQALHRHGFAPGDNHVFWCAVDISWLAGQTHGVLGPLAVGDTALMFEGMLDTPSHARTWQLIARYGVTALVTTPSVVRSLRQWVDAPPGEQVASLQRITTIGEPIETDTRDWLRAEVGRGHAVVADGWGQTELGGVVSVAPTDGLGPPDPGLDIVDAAGVSVPRGQSGQLVLRHPWPGLMLGWLGGNEAAASLHGLYATGDLAQHTPDGGVHVLGRTDPVVSVSGQLVAAAEVRDVLLEHPLVEAAEVIDRPDRRTGQRVVACVVLVDDATPGDELARELAAFVHQLLGGLARPGTVAFCESWPADLERDVLRSALASLCASADRPSLRIDSKQLRAAVASQTGGHER